MMSLVPARGLAASLSLSLSLVLSAGFVSRAELPPEVQGLEWCAGDKDCLQWSVADGASGYTIYRGDGAGVSGLAGPALDSCTFGVYAAPTASDVGDPAPQALHWFLVTASNLEGEGSAGQSSTGPRLLDSVGPCAAEGGLVINEIDYDQAGTDFDEFIEIYNAGSADVDLTGRVVILVNGLSSFEYARVELGDAGPTLAAGAYLVVGTPSVLAALPAGTLSAALPSSSNNIQNGAPDGVALFDTTAELLLDALSYEGSITAAQFDGAPGTYNLVEGNATSAADSNSIVGSLGRFPNGSDTDDASIDWQFLSTPSPGAANPVP